MFLLPAKTPHSPSRAEGSIGLVIERKREGKDIPDGLLWFCENCNHKLYDVYFPLTDIEKDFLYHFEHFYNSKDLRTCNKCGTIMEADSRFTGK
jgi:3-hydroxyanthranilate 3,4-dioxygenase